jgi:hypothetical protein
MTLRLLPGLLALGLACSGAGASAVDASRGAAGGPAGSGGAAGMGGGFTGFDGGGGDAQAGTLLVDTTCGLVVTDACPNDHASDGHCGLEEAVLALDDQKSEYGCQWSGSMGLDDTILIPNSGTFSVTTTLEVSRAVTIRSPTPGTLATIQGADGNDLFGVAPMIPVSITFQDLHLIGAGQGLETQASGISISGETPDAGATINVTRCWIEHFSNGAIVATDVNLNVTDTTLDGNSNDYGDGGGGIFYDTNGDAESQVDFLTIANSSITHNHSTKGGGIQIQSSSISRITNSTISDNLTDGGHGGGISFANNAGPLADGILRITGSTIAFNGSTTFQGAGIAVGANQVLFPDNVDNQIYLAGSIVANNCLADMNPDASFTCLSPSDVAGEIYQLQDSLLGSSEFSTIIGPDRGGQGQDGITFIDVDAGLDTELTDQGGLGGHHPQVHMLNADSLAVDATDVLGTLNAVDQTHQPRGFDRRSSGRTIFDLGAVERRTNP